MYVGGGAGVSFGEVVQKPTKKRTSRDPQCLTRLSEQLLVKLMREGIESTMSPLRLMSRVFVFVGGD